MSPARGTCASSRPCAPIAIPPRPAMKSRRETTLPAVNGAIDGPVDRQVRTLVRKSARERFIDVDTEAGRIAWMHHTALETVLMREDPIRLFGVAHVLLNPEVVNAQIEVQRRCHANGTEIGRAVRAGLHLMHLREVRDLPQVRDAAGMNDGCPNVIDELLLNELLTVENRVEHLSDGNRRRRVLADQPEAGLQLRGRRIFQPEQMVWLQAPPQPRGPHRRP